MKLPFRSSSIQLSPPPPSVTRTAPASRDTRESIGEFIALTLATTVIFSVPVAVIVYAARWPAIVVAVWAGFVMPAAWIWFMVYDRGKLLQVVERVAQRDINQDGAIGEPPAPKPAPIRIEVAETHAGGRQFQFIIPPAGVSGQQMQTFAQGIVQGRPFTEIEWTGSAGLFSRDEFRAIRDQMIDRGFAQWRKGGKKQGIELTAKGRATLDGVAHHPTLQGGGRA